MLTLKEKLDGMDRVRDIITACDKYSECIGDKCPIYELPVEFDLNTKRDGMCQGKITVSGCGVVEELIKAMNERR
jgi:hypothetical protein